MSTSTENTEEQNASMCLFDLVFCKTVFLSSEVHGEEEKNSNEEDQACTRDTD